MMHFSAANNTFAAPPQDIVGVAFTRLPRRAPMLTRIAGRCHQYSPAMKRKQRPTVMFLICHSATTEANGECNTEQNGHQNIAQILIYQNGLAQTTGHVEIECRLK